MKPFAVENDHHVIYLQGSIVPQAIAIVAGNAQTLEKFTISKKAPTLPIRGELLTLLSESLVDMVTYAREAKANRFVYFFV